MEEYSNDSHPLYLYLLGDKDMRSDIILNHPDVLGFIYLYENNVRKAFMVNKVVDFKATNVSKKNSIIAISGDTEDYVPFSVPEAELLSDVFHITDCVKLTKIHLLLEWENLLKIMRRRLWDYQQNLTLMPRSRS